MRCDYDYVTRAINFYYRNKDFLSLLKNGYPRPVELLHQVDSGWIVDYCVRMSAKQSLKSVSIR